MERYSQFRDPGTGISPFLPPVDEPSRLPIALDYASIILRYLLALPRFVLLLATALLYAVFHDLLGTVLRLIGLSYIARGTGKAVNFLLCSFALLLLGFWYIPFERVSLRRGRPAVKTTGSIGNGAEAASPNSGSLIVCNWSSWIELLWLAKWYSPLFTEHSPRPGSVRSIGLLEAIWRTSKPSRLEQSPSSLSAPSWLSVRQLSAQSKMKALGPVVVFPECTTSNNRGLLTFQPVLKGLELKNAPQIFIICFKYHSTRPSPVMPVPRLVPHALRLCASVNNSLKVRMLQPAESPSSPSYQPMDQTASPSQSGLDSVSLACLALLGQVGRLRRTALGYREKETFLDYWAKSRR